jgi:hypothetical protein
MEMTMAHDRTKEKERPDESQPERRIIKLQYDDVAGAIAVVIVGVRPGKKARVLGGGAFEEQDLPCLAEKLTKLATEFALCDARAEGFFQGIEESEGEDA